MARTSIACALIGLASANDNGLARRPPQGWRSWNLYGGNVNQVLIEGIMDGMVKKTHMIDGIPTSLCDLGYCDVGLDDNWQACKSPEAAPGMNYHAKNGTPLINYERFPSLGDMVKHAHALNLTSGFYGNNCICSDHAKGDMLASQIKGDVALLHDMDFDAWKLDGCGAETDLVAINAAIKEAGKPIMVENCHWGSRKPFKPDRTKPPAEGCPWNFYRTSGDVRASYGSIIHNLGTTIPLASQNLSYPGCWAYPDMLQVGCAHGPGGKNDPGLSIEESRTHFGAWAIVSSPLTLSHDVNNATISDTIWPIIANKEALMVNQAYSGHSGSQFKASETEITLAQDAVHKLTNEYVTTPSSQMLYKPLEPSGAAKTAVLMMNSDTVSAKLTVDFKDIPEVTCTKCNVRCIWSHTDLGTFTDSYTVAVDGHDAAFLIITPA